MVKQKIIGLNGSPNKEGNTAYLLNRALEVCREAGAEIELLNCRDYLKDLKNPFCLACSSPCTGKCYKDTSLQVLFDKLCLADGLLVGSPVYFGTVSAQLKSVWDKSRMLRHEKKLLNVVGGALTVGGSRYGGQETTTRAIHDMLLVQGLIIVGDGYIDDDCGHYGASAQRPADEDENAIKRARILGKRVVQLAEATSLLRKR